MFQLGVTQDTEYKTPNSEYMSQRARKQWLSTRADLALIIAAHRGHTEMVTRLIDEGIFYLFIYFCLRSRPAAQLSGLSVQDSRLIIICYVTERKEGRKCFV